MRTNKLPSVSRRWLAATALAAAAAAPLQASASGFGEFAACRSTRAVDFAGTIVDAAVATPALSTLVSLVTQAGLAGALSAPGNLTVFAPTNEAFGKIPPAVLGTIGGDPAVLSAVLTYHVVPGPADPRRLQIGSATTLQGQPLYLRFLPRVGPTVNQSLTSCQAVRTSNGTVWIVDSVLLPQFR